MIHRTLLSRRAYEPEEVSRKVIGNLVKWYELQGGNADPADLISIVEGFPLLDQVRQGSAFLIAFGSLCSKNKLRKRWMDILLDI